MNVFSLDPMIARRAGNSLAEIGFDRRRSQFHQGPNLRAVPVSCLRIGEVNDRVVHPAAGHGFRVAVGRASGILCKIALLAGFQVILVVLTRGDKIILPKRDAEAVLPKPAKVSLGIGKALLGKAQVAVPIGFKPGSIEVQQVAGDVMLPQLTANALGFVPGGVAVAAHPQSKAPHRRHFGKAGQGTVPTQDFFGIGMLDDKIVHLVIQHRKSERRTVGRAHLPVGRSGGIQKEAVALGGEVKRDVDIGAGAGGSDGVLIPEINRPALARNRIKPLPQPVDFLLGRQAQRLEHRRLLPQAGQGYRQHVGRGSIRPLLSKDGFAPGIGSANGKRL